MDLIREARLRAGISQRELADRIGTSQPAVARWENGTVDPTFESLKGAVNACGMDLTLSVEYADASTDSLLFRQLSLTPKERMIGMRTASRTFGRLWRRAVENDRDAAAGSHDEAA